MRMIEPVASGTSEDVEAVAPELAMLPGSVLQALHDQGVGVRVCRESVTDYRTDLIGRLPRGWPEGVDWSRVPGCYCPDERNVVIATIGTPDGRRVVPPKGIKHNAWNLVLHETMHADDYIAERSRCRNPYFLAAREADIDALTSYEARQGQAGYEETYAESAGRHFGQDPSLQLDCPALAEFWTATALPVDPGPPPTELVMESIGFGLMEPSGTIILDLRAEAPNGIIGDALLRIGPRSEIYEGVRKRLQQSGPLRAGVPVKLHSIRP